MLPAGPLLSICVVILASQVVGVRGQPNVAPAIRNSSLSPLATYTLTVTPWTNH